MISFVPLFRIEGTETFYRFAMAGMTGQVICVAVGLLFFIRDWTNGWPFLLAGSCFTGNDAIRSLLIRFDLIDPLTELVGSMSQPLTFIATFALFFTLLAATTLPAARQARPV